MSEGAPQRKRIDLRQRETWVRFGYALSAGWMLLVVVLSGGDPRHPLFIYIFLVPLAGWALALVVEALVRRLRGPRG